MESSSLAKIPKTYPELLRAVKLTLLAGQAEIDRAWGRCYHETGRLITEHILLFKDRADYGAKTYHRLARDTGGSERRLYQCTQFYRCFPILQTSAQLTWSHYSALCRIDDPKLRAKLTAEANRNGWIVAELEKRVLALNAAIDIGSGAAAKPAVELLTPLRGVAGRYRVVAVADGFGLAGDEGLCVDLGFKLYLPLAPASARFRTKGTERGSAEMVSARCWPEAKAKGADRRVPVGLRAAQIVSVDADGGIAAVPDAKPADLFTYAVTVRRVIDGDTVEVAIPLPHFVHRLKLRLRGLDCPEMDTPEGKAAKREVEKLVSAAQSVTIYTSKPDKYDRYLADVFFTTADGTEVFLNNHLLASGFARRMDADDFGDGKS